MFVMFKTQYLEKVSMPNSEEVTGLERLRNEIIEQVGGFYELTSEALAEAKKVEIYLMGTPEAEAAVRTYISYDTEGPEEGLEQLIQTQLRDATTKGGIWLSKTKTYEFRGRKIRPKSTTNIIILNSKVQGQQQKHLLRHELIHELSDDKEGGTGVFDRVPSTNINEALTELFNLAMIWDTKDIGELINKVENSRCSYRKQVLEFLGIISILKEGEEGALTLNKVAEIYFNPSLDSYTRRVLLSMEIIGRTSKEHRELVNKYLSDSGITVKPKDSATTIAVI